MRNRLLSFVIALLLALAPLTVGGSFASRTSAAEGGTMELVPSTGVYSTAGDFPVDILVHTGSYTISAARADFVYDPSQLTLVSIDTTGSVLSTAAPTDSWTTADGKSEVRINRYTVPPAAFSGNGVLARLTFHALTAGVHTVTLRPTDSTVSPVTGSLLLTSDTSANILSSTTSGSYALVDPGLVLSPGSLNLEEGGATGSYTVALQAPPSANVTVGVSGDSYVTAAPSSLTFTPANWNTPQTVTVTAVDDAAAEGTHTGTITHTVTSTGADYNGLAAGSVTVTIADNDFTLGVTTVGSGTVTKSPDQAAYTKGASVQLTEAPATGWSFTGWSGDLTGSTNPANITMDANKNVTATFAINTYTLTYTAGANGTITGTSPQTVNYGANGASVTATPATGYHFVSWSDGRTDNPRTDTNVQGNVTVTASFAANTTTVTITSGGHGTVTPTAPVSQTYGAAGTAITATAETGYHFAGWTASPAGSISIANPAAASTTFTTTASAPHNGTATVTASFAINTFTITASAGTNGSIAPSGVSIVNYGGSQSYTITPNAGYSVADVVVDGTSVGPRTDYTFANVTGNHSIAASFTLRTYTITASAGSNGSITPAGAVPVINGSSQSFTITPASGYHVADVLVDGSSVGAVTSYTFSNVTDDHWISASFAINMYAITASAGAHGSISPFGMVPVSYHGSQTFTMTPDPGYHIADVLVDGASVGAVAEYSFTSVTSGHSISVSFAIDTHTLTTHVVGSGSVAKSPDQAAYDYGSSVQLDASPATGWHFDHWSGDTSGATFPAPQTMVLTMNEDRDVTATFAINTYTITASADPNGSISPSGSVPVNYGGSQSFDIRPDTGYHLTGVLVDGVSVGTPSSYMFDDVTANHTITATFAINTYTITASAGPNGSIAPAGAILVNFGMPQTFTMTPADGYHVADVLIDGGSVGARSSYTFPTVVASHTIAVTFAINTYTLTYTAGANGTITGTSPQTVNYGADGTEVTAIPNQHYHFVSWSDGVMTAARTDTKVTADVTVTATFAINTYTLTYTAGANGTITGTSPQTVNYGANGASVTATPATGYHFVSWSDGRTDNPRTDTNVQGNVTVTASFAANTTTVTITSGGHGTVTPTAPVSQTYGAAGTAITATAETGYHFAGWTASPAGSISIANPAAASTTFTTTASAANGSTATVTATFAINTYTLTYAAGANGTITGTSPQTVNYGANGASVTAAPATGYHFVSWSDGRTDNPRTDTNVQGDVTVTATFAINTYTLTYTAGVNGTITGTSPQTVNYGANGTAVTATPTTGYHFVSWSDGRTDNPRTDTNVQRDVTVTASFEINMYSITATAGAHGSISPAGEVLVPYGSSPVFTITPVIGYHVADVLVDGVSVGACMSHTFPDVKEDGHTIAVTFTINTYPITATAGAHGFISPAGTASVNYGSSQTFAMTPDPGYHVADVLVDGASVGAVTSYAFLGVVTDHAIAATFAINTYALTTDVIGKGSVTTSPQQALYTYGTPVTLTATPASGWQFLRWIGDLSSTTDPVTVTMDGNKNITAWFVPSGYGSDTTAPSLVVHAPLGTSLTGTAGVANPPSSFLGLVNSSTYDLSIDASDASGAVLLTVSVNGSEVVHASQSGTAPYTLSLADGRQDVAVTARDAAGNFSTACFSLVVDTIGPSIEVGDLPVSVGSSRLTIRGTVSDVTSGVASVLVNGADALAGSTFASTVTLVAGANHIVITAADAAGNTTEREVTVTYVPVEERSTILQLTIGKTAMYVNGEPVKLDAAPVIRQARTMLPIRAIAEAIKATVSWNAKLGKVTIVRGGTTIELWIGKNTARVNGTSVRIDTANAKVVPFITNGRTLLPLRFIAEALGLDVEWNASTQVVTLTLQP